MKGRYFLGWTWFPKPAAYKPRESVEFKNFSKVGGMVMGQTPVDSEAAETGEGIEMSGSESFSCLTMKLSS